MPQRMTGIDIVETSGVDHPAHLHEGFLVMKSKNPERARRIMAAVKNREGTSMEKNEQEALAKAVAEPVAKAVAEQIKPILDALAASWKDLRAVAEAEDEETPSTDPAAPEADAAAAAAGADVLAAQAALKALPEHLRGVVQKARDEARDARETAQKAIDERLDDQAVTASRAAYKSLAIDHDTVAPILRRIEATQPDVAKSLRETLAAADAQAGESLLLKEVGTARQTTTTAMTEAKTLATKMVADGVVETVAKGVSKAFEVTPGLYARHLAEQKG